MKIDYTKTLPLVGSKAIFARLKNKKDILFKVAIHVRIKEPLKYVDL